MTLRHSVKKESLNYDVVKFKIVNEINLNIDSSA